MKKLLTCSIMMVMLAIAGCENPDKPTSLVGKRTKVLHEGLREQNAILERIAVALEKMSEAKGETK